MPILQLSEKGQVLIPRRLRDRMGLKPGSPVQVIEEEDHLILKAVPPDPIAASAGFLNIKGSLTKELLREHQREARRERKVGRR